MLKMPTEKVVLFVEGNKLTAYSCEKESFIVVEAYNLSLHMQESIAMSKKIALEELEIPSNEVARATTKSKEYKEVELVPGDKFKLACIRLDLELNWKTCSSAS